MGVSSAVESYQSQSHGRTASAPLERALSAHAAGQLTRDLLFESVIALQGEERPTAEKWLEGARSCVTVAYLAQRLPLDDRQKAACGEYYKQLVAGGYWKHLQLGEALLALAAEWLGISAPPCKPRQLPTGAASLDYSGFYSELQLPHQQLHAELGICWALLGAASKQRPLVDAAIHLAEWQLNLLDSHAQPMAGMFNREQDGCPDRLHAIQALLFELTARLSQRGDLAAIASAQRSRMAKGLAHPPLVAVAEGWMHSHLASITASSHVLPEVICDPHSSLVGCRQAEYSVIATLCGGFSGLGTYRGSEVGIVSYGPAELPLGECTKYGILRPVPQKDVLGTSITLKAEKHQFDIRGRVQMAAPLGAWLDVRQDFQNGRLGIQTTFYSLEPLKKLAFCFFVDAPQCTVDQGETLKAQSLDRYTGPVRPVHIEGPNERITITALSNRGEMQVIPLAGGPNFWGSRFLIAQVLDPTQFSYSWQIRDAQDGPNGQGPRARQKPIQR